MRYFKVKVGTTYADRFVGSDTDFGFAQNDSGYKTVPTKRSVEITECRITTDFAYDAEVLSGCVSELNSVFLDETGASADVVTPTSVYYMLGRVSVEEEVVHTSELDLSHETRLVDDGEYLVCEHLGIKGRYTESFAPERIFVDMKFRGKTKARFSGNFDACNLARIEVERYLRYVEERTIDEIIFSNIL